MLRRAVRDKAVSFVVVLGAALALLASLLVSTVLSAVGSTVSDVIRSPAPLVSRRYQRLGRAAHGSLAAIITG